MVERDEEAVSVVVLGGHGVDAVERGDAALELAGAQVGQAAVVVVRQLEHAQRVVVGRDDVLSAAGERAREGEVSSRGGLHLAVLGRERRRGHVSREAPGGYEAL